MRQNGGPWELTKFFCNIFLWQAATLVYFGLDEFLNWRMEGVWKDVAYYKSKRQLDRHGMHDLTPIEGS